MIVWLYRAALAVLPPDVRHERDETVRTFAALWREANGTGPRARLALRSFGRLPGLVAVEWLEYLGARRAPGREQRGWRMGTWRNVRYAVRTLGRTPAFTLSAVLLVALGVGAATTTFTVVDHVLLRPLPYPGAERLVILEEGNHTGPFFHAVEEMGTLESHAAAHVESVTLLGRGDPLRLRQASVTRDFFGLYAARALHGRLPVAADFRGEGDAVLLDGGAWQRVWGGDPGVVGRTIEVDGVPRTVIGVLDPTFEAPLVQVGEQVDLWRPIDWSRDLFTNGDAHALQVTARLRDGLDVAAAQAELDATMATFSATEGNENYRREDEAARAIPVTPLSERTTRGVRRGLGLLAGAVGLLLLVACVNVAHMFLARGLGRTREMAVRRAMGASTGALVAQLLVESLVVALAGGLAGAAAARAGVSSFVALYPGALPRADAVAVDARVLLFAVGASVATALAFGLLPALRSVGRDPADELRGAGRSHSSGRRVLLTRNGLVAAEVALSLVLVAGAGLLLRSFLTVRGQEPGFGMEDVWMVPLNPTELETPEEWAALMENIRDAAAAVPGVRVATYGLTMPLQWTQGRCCWLSTTWLDGEETPSAPYMHPVGPGYFEALGIELLAGRVWTPAEAPSDPWPVVLGETYAVETFGSADAAIGRLLGTQSYDFVVIGVARDTRHYGLDRDPVAALYLPAQHVPFAANQGAIAVKVDPQAADAMPRALREAVWSVAPRLAVPTVRRLEEWASVSTASRRFGSVLSATFAGLALLLAAGGVYGTLLFTAGERRREMGIRLALGASRRQVEGSLVGTAFALALVGVVAGLAGTWATSRFIESQVWGVERNDPLTLAGAALVMLATALIASWVPARRAGRVDPAKTLRLE